MIKLIGVLVAGIPALISMAIAQMSRKWVTVTAAIGVLMSVTAMFITAINMCIAMLLPYTASIPGQYGAAIMNGIGMFVPANFGAVLGCVVSVQLARGAYDLARERIHLWNSGT